jgi:hypothetical protein
MQWPENRVSAKIVTQGKRTGRHDGSAKDGRSPLESSLWLPAGPRASRVPERPRAAQAGRPQSSAARTRVIHCNASAQFRRDGTHPERQGPLTAVFVRQSSTVIRDRRLHVRLRVDRVESNSRTRRITDRVARSVAATGVDRTLAAGGFARDSRSSQRRGSKSHQGRCVSQSGDDPGLSDE